MKYFLYCRKSTESEDRQVLSLQSQRDAVNRAILGKSDIEIVDVFEESKSAKTPGRPVFATMMARIEAGEAEGILSWAPDRLARNSIDGGHVIYLLDTGVLRDLKFATYTFENNSQGKFMLTIMFGQSKYYSDALSENVKRGNRSKIAQGWRPNRAPLGYLNDPATKTIVPDPALFALIRRMFELVLYEGKNPHEVAHIAKFEWGILTPKTTRSGGAPISRSAVYKALTNPFYMGRFEWNGVVHEGRHKPIVSPGEFARVREKLAERSSRRSSTRAFAFTGLVRCGTCNRMITAERKTKAGGRSYVYYHCAARGALHGNCAERSLDERGFSDALQLFLTQLVIDDVVAGWARAHLKLSGPWQRRGEEQRSREAALKDIDTQLAELTSLRLRNLIADDEFSDIRGQLKNRQETLSQASPVPDPSDLIEPLDNLIFVSNSAVDWFPDSTNLEKRQILKIVGSNPTLRGKKLSIQAAKPFLADANFEPRPRLLGDVDQVRTDARAKAKARRLVRALAEMHATPAGRAKLADIKQLVDRHRAP